MRTSYAKNRFSNEREPDISGGWQIIYTGFILIMLSFFILLSSFSSPQDAKVSRFVRSFSSALSIFQHGGGIAPGEIPQDAKINHLDQEDHVARLFERIQELGSNLGLNGIDLRTNERGVIMTLADTLLFPSGEARINEQAYPLLIKIGELIAQAGTMVEIEGHTDDMPIQTDHYPSNWELSAARAINVLRFLLAHSKIDPSGISASGRSEYQPLYPNDSEVNQAANRRVVFIFEMD